MMSQQDSRCLVHKDSVCSLRSWWDNNSPGDIGGLQGLVVLEVPIRRRNNQLDSLGIKYCSQLTCKFQVGMQQDLASDQNLQRSLFLGRVH